MPNIHFGLASRAMLESDEVVAASNVFTVNAVVEGLAGLAAVYESFVPASDRNGPCMSGGAEEAIRADSP